MTSIFVRDRRGSFGYRQTGKEAMWDRERDWMLLKARNTKGCQRPPEARRESWNRFFSRT